MAATPTRSPGSYICGKVRRFGERVYGEDRLLYPAVRQGAKGQGTFVRVTWDEALDQIAQRMIAIRDSVGAEAILPFCYGGSNGLLTQDTNDARLFRGFGTSRLARTVCAAPTGAANLALYGKMPGVTYRGLRARAADRAVGRQSRPPRASTSCRSSRKRATAAPSWSSSIRARRRWRGRPICTSRRGPAPTCRSRWRIHRYLFERGLAATAFLAEHARGVEGLRARAEEWTIERAARVCEIDPADLERFAALYAAPHRR